MESYSSSFSSPFGEDQLRLVADTLPAYIAYVDRELRYSMVNRRYLEQFNRAETEILGHSVAEVLGPSFESVRSHLLGALEGRPQHFHARIRTVTGDRILAVTHLPDRAADGEIRGIIIHGVDVTEHVQSEDLLRRSEERFRILIERASNGICIGDIHGALSFLNPALLEILGYTEEEVSRGEVRWDELTPSKYLPLDQAAVAQLIASGHATPYEKAYRAKDGRLVPLLLGATLIPSLGGAEAHDVAVFVTDLTAQKAAEAVLRQSEKLAAVGKLAASVSHELNNPLEALTNLLYLIRQDETLTPHTRDYLEIADREVARMAQVTSHSLRFHHQSTQAAKVALQPLLADALSYFSARLENFGIVLRTDLSATPEITCYEADLRQVLNNLLGNAIDALRGPGCIVVRTRAMRSTLTGAPGVRITVADDGCGMPPAVLKRIFEAFFTTKGNNGTGLGLWISQRLVEKHHGSLRARSSVLPHRGGTTFSLWLPVQLPDADAEF